MYEAEDNAFHQVPDITPDITTFNKSKNNCSKAVDCNLLWIITKERQLVSFFE